MTAIVPLTELAFDEAKALFVEIRDSAEHVWILLMRARDHKAWKAVGYSSWDECVKNEFQMSKRYANQLINYGQLQAVLMDKAEVGAIAPTLPANEAQARELRGLEPELAREVLKAAKDAAAETGKPVTSKHIKAAVRAKRNGTAAAPEPPHAPGTITDAELAADKGDPVWLSTFHFRECDESQQIKAAGLFFNDMKPKNQVLVTALYLSAMSPEQLAELGRHIDLALLGGSSK